MSTFERENRYVVFKVKDLVKLSPEHQHMLHELSNAVLAAREARGKSGIECVVIENDWPEYETVWQMVQNRVTGKYDAKPDGEAVEYVHSVPYHCDRVVWRGDYYHLPITHPSNDAMRKDAERYRWIRDNYHGFEHLRSGVIPYVTVDSEVDNAMRRQALANGEGES